MSGVNRHMPPVCLNCNSMMQVANIGLTIVEYTGRSLATEKPYSLYQTDEFYCKRCGARVTQGNGNVHFRHEEGFDDMLLRAVGNVYRIHEFPNMEP